MTSFKLLLSTREEQVLEALKKTYPTTKASSVVDLCSKIIFNIDPRFPTFLKPIWSGRLVSKCGRAKACPT